MSTAGSRKSPVLPGSIKMKLMASPCIALWGLETSSFFIQLSIHGQPKTSWWVLQNLIWMELFSCIALFFLNFPFITCWQKNPIYNPLTASERQSPRSHLTKKDMQFCISIKRARIISQLPQALENWLGLDLLQQIVIKIVEISLFRTWFADCKVSIFFRSFQFRPLHKAH